MTGTAAAQGAWVNDPKSLTVTFGYEFAPSDAIVVGNGKPDISDRPTTNHMLTLGAEYVPFENLALEVAVPFEAVSYDGTMKHTPPGKWDDGAYHTTPGDLRFGARYQVLDEPYLALTPYVAATLPMVNYETVGFATGGRNLRQMHFGVSAGRSFAPFLRKLFVTAGYEFTWSQKFDATADTAQFNENRSDVEGQLGYVFLDGDLVINLAANYRQHHGGIEFSKAGTWTTDELRFHDPILKESYIFYGGGLSYAINTSLTISANVRMFLEGANTRDQSLYELALSWRAL